MPRRRSSDQSLPHEASNIAHTTGRRLACADGVVGPRRRERRVLRGGYPVALRGVPRFLLHLRVAQRGRVAINKGRAMLRACSGDTGLVTSLQQESRGQLHAYELGVCAYGRVGREQWVPLHVCSVWLVQGWVTAMDYCRVTQHLMHVRKSVETAVRISGRLRNTALKVSGGLGIDIWQRIKDCFDPLAWCCNSTGGTPYTHRPATALMR